MDVDQYNTVDADRFNEYLSEKSRYNRINLCDLIIVHNGKGIRLTDEQVLFYTETGLSNICIIEDILDNIE